MSKIIITSDIHHTEKEPFYTSKKLFNKWLKDQDFHNENNSLVIIGDVTDKSIHTGKINRLLVEFFSNLKFKRIIIVTGNHDISRKDGNVLDVLKALPNIEIVEDITEDNIDGIKCMFLPHLIRKTRKDKLMKEIYENLEVDADYIFGHFANETQTLFGNYIDTKHMKGKKILGHVHIQSEDFVGCPVITRYDERNQDNRIGCIDTETKKLSYIPVPKFLDYRTTQYGEELKSDIPCVVWDIENAPSKEAVYNNKMYKNIYWRKIILKEDESSSNIEFSDDDSKSILDYFKLFCKDNKVTKKVQQKVESVL